MVPAGSLDRDTDIALAVGGQPPVGVPDLFQAAGPAVHGDLGGAHLTHGATLRLPLPAGVTGGVGAGYLDEQARAWLPRQAAIDSRARVLTLQVPHLSWYQPWTWDPVALKSKLERYFGKLVGYGVALRTDPPHCAAAPSGVAAAVTGGRSGDPSLDGCVEDAGGGNVRLRLINNRPYGMVVTAPDGSRLESVSRGGLLAALYQEKKSLAHVGGDYLPSGGEADYILPATGPIVTAIGVWSWKTYTLDAAVAMLLTVAGEGAPPAGAAAAAKVGASASKVPPAKLARVGLCLGDKLFSEPPTDAASAIRDNIACLGELNDIWLAPLALVQGLIIDLAGALDAGQDLSVGSAGTVTVSRPARQPSSVTLSSNGLGPFHPGMSLPEASAAATTLGLKVTAQQPGMLCRYISPSNKLYLVYLTGPPEQMKVAVVEVSQKGVRTDRGIGVGNTEAEVTAAYPQATVMMVEPTVTALVEDFPDGTALRFSLDPATNTVDYLLGGDRETVHAYEICS